MNKNKIKILYVVSTLRRSGPTNQLLGIIKNLDRNLFEPKILTLSPEPSDSMAGIFLENEIHVDSLDLSRIQFFYKGKKSLKKYITQYKPDIVHTQGIRADSSISELKLKVKHCMTIRNYVYEDYTAKFGKIIGNIAAIKAIKAIKNCEYPVFCSKTLENMYKKNIFNKRYYTIQNGVDSDKYNPVFDNSEKKKLRTSLGMPHDKIIFLVVGSLIKRKDPITIIRAFNQIKYKEKAVLIFLGEGDLFDECKKLANKNNIIFKGNVENVSSYLKASDIFISASKSEGLPNSVLEAGSTGMNMILSDIPQHKELFKEIEELVCFFKPEDIQDLTEKINNQFDERKKMNNFTISQHIIENFSVESMSIKYQELYLKMMD